MAGSNSKRSRAPRKPQLYPIRELAEPYLQPGDLDDYVPIFGMSDPPDLAGLRVSAAAEAIKVRWVQGEFKLYGQREGQLPLELIDLLPAWRAQADLSLYDGAVLEYWQDHRRKSFRWYQLHYAVTRKSVEPVSKSELTDFIKAHADKKEAEQWRLAKEEWPDRGDSASWCRVARLRTPELAAPLRVALVRMAPL